jgi:hypothetical protein
METGSLLAKFDSLVPLASGWAAEQEKQILREGIPLSAAQIDDARQAGVKEPEKVRLLQVETIPSPTHPILQAACQATNFVPAEPRGLTIQYGVFVRSDCWSDRPLLVHELVHTAQYERLGGIEPFLRRYLFECATMGYSAATMEKEAITTAARVCG